MLGDRVGGLDRQHRERHRQELLAAAQGRAVRLWLAAAGAEPALLHELAVVYAGAPAGGDVAVDVS